MGSIDDQTRAQVALDDASAEIRAFTRRSWVDGDALALPTGVDAWKADVLVRVCCSIARRVLDNPEGVQQESIGSYSVTNANASSDVYLTRAERRLLQSVAGSSAIGTIDLEIGTPRWTGDFIGVYSQDEPLPFTYEPLLP